MDDFYTILGLDSRRADPSLTILDIRKAYHQSLLRHHPDKVDRQAIPTPQQPAWTVTIDQITTAFKTLSDAQARAEYDRSLRAIQTRSGMLHENAPTRFFSGLDIADLDDLDFDEDSATWKRACRCGHDQGFVITEDELEKTASQGELIIGCRGCSLWLKVLFQVAHE